VNPLCLKDERDRGRGSLYLHPEPMGAGAGNPGAVLYPARSNEHTMSHHLSIREPPQLRHIQNIILGAQAFALRAAHQYLIRYHLTISTEATHTA
jgi:hypothetical protein